MRSFLAVLVQWYCTGRLFNGKCVGADDEEKNWTEDVVGEGWQRFKFFVTWYVRYS